MSFVNRFNSQSACQQRIRIRTDNCYSAALMLTLPLLLAGCSGMNTQFGCDAVASSQCTPVSRINAQAEAGVFDRFLVGQTDKESDEHQTAAQPVNSNANQDLPNHSSVPVSDSQSLTQQKRAAAFSQFRWGGARQLIADEKAAVASGLLRSPERIQRLWIAPYEDAAHRYHGASEVLVVLEPAHWVSAIESEKKQP